MSLFRRHRRHVPTLNTAALPDLIFTVLFFFMIVTQMRQVDMKVEVETPQGVQLDKLTHRSTISHVYIGRPADGSEAAALQLNDKIATPKDIGRFVREERRRMSPADRERMIVSIKADKGVKMGIITDVKKELRRHGALKINYSGEEERP